MDSGNSGSLQSSSGGDDQEYDSTFLNSTTTGGGAASFHQLPPPPPQFHHQALFDTFSFLDSNLNLEIPWTSLRPNPSSTDVVQTLIPSPLPRPAVPATYPSPASDHPPAPAARPSKKRSRASRRAPTTVLTTDTSNFRAMVQEFTGIPSPPFASSSSSTHFSRSRLDLFRSPPLPYLLRPFAGKFQQTAISSNPVPAPTTNYQLPSPDLGRHDLLMNFYPFLQSSISPNPLVPPIPTDQGSYEGGVNGTVMSLPGSAWSAREEVSQAQFRPVAAAGGSQKAASCKMNLVAAAAAAEFGGGDKVSDHNAPARGSEVMMESWICSSD